MARFLMVLLLLLACTYAYSLYSDEVKRQNSDPSIYCEWPTEDLTFKQEKRCNEIIFGTTPKIK